MSTGPNLLQFISIERTQVSDFCTCSRVPPLTAVFESFPSSYLKVEPLNATGAIETGL